MNVDIELEPYTCKAGNRLPEEPGCDWPHCGCDPNVPRASFNREQAYATAKRLVGAHTDRDALTAAYLLVDIAGWLQPCAEHGNAEMDFVCLQCVENSTVDPPVVLP